MDEPVAAQDDPDAELLARMRGGDQTACAVLVDRHLPALHRLGWRLLGDAAEAEDVSQEAFLRAWQQVPTWRPGAARFGTWLYQVALNLCRDRLRARRPLAELGETLGDPSPQPDQCLAQDQRQQALQGAIAELPERQREALLLFHYQGLSQQDAAAILGVSEDAFESLLARARRALKQRLSPPRPAAAATEPRA